jgi:hypothetical protein
MGTRDPDTNEETIAMPFGITLRFNPIDDKSRLLSQLDSIFAVSLIESSDHIKLIDTPSGGLSYYSHPYEQFCKENFSFLSKYLRQAKVSSGLDFLLEDWGFDQDDSVAS